MGRKKFFEPLKMSKYILWGIVVILVLILNYWYLKKYLSFNSSYATDYQVKEDTLAQYRNPAVAGLFYEASPQELSKNVDGYLKTGTFTHSINYQPKMIIVPHAGYAYSAGTAAKAYVLLQKYADKIKLLLLGYKNIGRGAEYHKGFTQSLRQSIRADYLKEKIPELFDKLGGVFFDNLAIEQLRLFKDHLVTQEQIDLFYMGDEGEQSFYLDLVDGTYAKSSCEPKENTYKIESDNVNDLFKNIRDNLRD